MLPPASIVDKRLKLCIALSTAIISDHHGTSKMRQESKLACEYVEYVASDLTLGGADKILDQNIVKGGCQNVFLQRSC